MLEKCNNMHTLAWFWSLAKWWQSLLGNKSLRVLAHCPSLTYTGPQACIVLINKSNHISWYDVKYKATGAERIRGVTIIVICILLMSVLKASISWLNHDIWSYSLAFKKKYVIFCQKKPGTYMPYLSKYLTKLFWVEPGTFLPGQLTLFQPEGQIMPTTLLLAVFLNVLLFPQIHIILINIDEN